MRRNPAEISWQWGHLLSAHSCKRLLAHPDCQIGRSQAQFCLYKFHQLGWECRQKGIFPISKTYNPYFWELLFPCEIGSRLLRFPSQIQNHSPLEYNFEISYIQNIICADPFQELYLPQEYWTGPPSRFSDLCLLFALNRIGWLAQIEWLEPSEPKIVISFF